MYDTTRRNNGRTDMKKIILTNKQIVLIDDKDYEVISKHNWYLSNGGYAISSMKAKNVRMHRFILNAPVGEIIDHINGNKLDNRRKNLRICTPKENIWNRHSKNIGIRHHKYYKGRVWEAKIGLNYKTIYLGSFYTKKEAQKAYSIAKKQRDNNMEIKI